MVSDVSIQTSLLVLSAGLVARNDNALSHVKGMECGFLCNGWWCKCYVIILPNSDNCYEFAINNMGH